MSEYTINHRIALKDNIKFLFLNPKILFQRSTKVSRYGMILLILILTKIINTIVSVNLPKDIMNKIIENQTRGIDPQFAEIVKNLIYIINKPAIQVFLSVGGGTVPYSIYFFMYNCSYF